MAVPTFNNLIDDKVIRRGDKGFTIKLEDIHFRPGFNPREEGPRLQEDLKAKAQFTFDNGMENMPQIKVEPREEGGVWAVDGHGRTRSTRMAIAMGAKLESKDGKVWMPIKPFYGDAVARHIEVVTSQTSLKLTPLELMVQFKRLADGVEGCEPLTPVEISKRTGYDRQYVDQLLKLAEGGPEVHAMVRSGQVSADVAQELVRKHGDQAAAELNKELEKAKAQGKTKVTKGTIKGASLPSSVVNDITDHVKRVVQSIPVETHSILDRYRAQTITDGDTPVSIPVRELLALVMCAGHIDDVRADQERKAQEKAAKAVKAATAAMEAEHGGAE